MPALILKIAFIAGLVVEMIVRAPIDRKRRANNTVASRQTGPAEALVLTLLTLGSFVLPVLYIFTNWLAFADYSLPAPAGWLGIALLIAALVIFWRAHANLAENWSPTLEIREGHDLITSGIYGYIRHPMYASQWLFVFAQALLLQNWLAGVGGIIAFLPMYVLRVPAEEKMMLERFGQAYRDYMARTGRVLPRL